MNPKLLILALLGLLVTPELAIGQYEIAPKDMARFPGAKLLVGYPPHSLAVTNGDETIVLRPDPLPGPAAGDATRIYPGISGDGNVVAAARWRGGLPDRIVSIATYSITEQKWTAYRTGKYQGAVAISGNGEKLAFGEEIKKTVTGYVHPVTVINLKTGRESAGPELPVGRDTSQSTDLRTYQLFLSWSPDGERLVYGNNTTIWVWDADTQQTRKIGEGSAPAWSPSGEWIAFLDSSRNPNHSSCSVVRPDGTGEKTLAILPRGRLFLEEPVWSPDSKVLLLNEMADGEKWSMNIDFLDLATLKLTRKLKDKAPVYGWAKVKTN